MAPSALCILLFALVLQNLVPVVGGSVDAHHKGKHHHHKGKHHHHKGHKHHHGKHHHNASAHHPLTTKAADNKEAEKPAAAKVQLASKTPTAGLAHAAAEKAHGDDALVAKMKALEARLAKKSKEGNKVKEGRLKGHVLVSGPLPRDFGEQFTDGVAAALNVDVKKVEVLKTLPVASQPGVFDVEFESSPKVVTGVQSQATDPDSKLATGNLHNFLVSRSDDGGDDDGSESKTQSKEEASGDVTPVQEKGIDIDTAMPYGDLEPFGREDTAQELTESSVKESDEMVDQLERAEVAEEKRAVFRALTRLRGAAITSFDGVARSQTGNIDEYNKVHKWRNTHPLHHLADEESDISKWAFPDNADF